MCISHNLYETFGTAQNEFNDLQIGFVGTLYQQELEHVQNINNSIYPEHFIINLFFTFLITM